MRGTKRSNKKKIKKANSFVFWLFRGLFKVFLRLKYKFKFDKKTSKGIKRPCIILCNHQTSFDQFAIPQGFNFGINFVANENIFRHGLLSRLMCALVRPIPIAKGTVDTTAVKHIMSVVKDGGAVALFPSGNRSFYGDECRINPTIGKLAKKLGVPVVLVNFRGGFNTKPRWGNKPNKGKMTGAVTRVISPEELSTLPADELNDIILKELNFNEFAWNVTQKIKYKGKHKAEYLESVLFWCHECHRLDTMYSQGNRFFCAHCNASVQMGDTGMFEEKSTPALPDTILEWSQKQLEYIKQFDLSPYHDKPLFSDTGLTFFESISTTEETPLGSGKIELFADKIRLNGASIPISTIKDLSVGVFVLNIYTDTKKYVCNAPKNISLIKYMILAYHIKNKTENFTEEYYGY